MTNFRCPWSNSNDIPGSLLLLRPDSSWCGVFTWSDNKIRKLATVCLPCACLVPTGQRVNQVYYLEVLKRLHENVRRKRPELFANNSWILYHDNAPAHTALSVREILATKQITVLEHPAYSPDLDPNDFFTVSEDKGNIERKVF